MNGFFIHSRWFLLFTVVAVTFVVSFFVPSVWYVAILMLVSLILFTLVDVILLFRKNKSVNVERHTDDRWHLGESNVVKLAIENNFGMSIHLELIDELPHIFQNRNFLLKYKLPAASTQVEQYELTPFYRGLYKFGALNVFVMSPFKLLKRRIIIEQETNVKVYPTTKYLKAFQLNAISDPNSLIGVKKNQKLGHSLEFEQIKEYVIGDDIRTINWKATARKASMMVNSYTDIRSQQIFCLIDKGRTMKMPFGGMTLLEYAIKACLVFSNIALAKHDKAGLVTFSSNVNDILPAETGGKQMHKILETLYHQETEFQDADFEKLFHQIHKKINQRSFLMLFTNFESLASFERQLPFLKSLAKRHLICVVFFENSAIKEIVENQPNTIQGIYTQTIAERFAYEKKQMVKELRRYGIIAILTTPEKLTVDVINNYLELKSRQLI